MADIFCEGCGVKIQTEDKNGLGYAPPSALENEHVVCQRCFRLTHYNEVQPVPLTDDDFLNMLSRIGETRALVVYLVDIFDFEGSWVPGIQRFIGDNPVLMVGNKEDLLPKSTNPNKLKNWIRRSAKQLGLKPVDVLLMSAQKNQGIDEVARNMEYYRKGRDVYIVGSTNVGKSTFINHLIKAATGEDEAITTSHFPGTTLDFIGIPLEDGSRIYDTPGVVNPHQMIHIVDARDYKQIMPKQEIKPRVYQVNENQTLFLGGLARIDYLGNGRRSLVVYASSALNIHRTKQEKADDLFHRQYGQLLVPPSKPEAVPDMKRYDFSTKDNTEMDVVFSGLGWVTIKGKGARISAYAPNGVGVYIRSSIIKG
ncbi:ribosome biogenesis GTPase YqeH [Sporolactobacillus sp. THM7-4]|nr:ribosome biogenesis GTPase YqeH [Sporolactobacillus sp. THM7-4]